MTLLQYNTNRLYIEQLYLDFRGYLRYVSNRMLFHRTRVERNIGRKLKIHEVVHHIDGNKRNNLLENLHLCSSWQEHESIHILQLNRYGDWNKPLKELLDH